MGIIEGPSWAAETISYHNAFKTLSRQWHGTYTAGSEYELLGLGWTSWGAP